MKQYLENEVLQKFVGDFYEASNGNRTTNSKAVGAICHGVVLAARSTSPTTGKSVLHGLKTTALTWRQERLAWRLTKYFARFWDPQYYRTYSDADGDPEGHMSVESEVKRALASDADFVDVPRCIADYKIKTNNRDRDSGEDARPAWVVRDGSYVSARWPGDAHTFAKTFLEVLESQ
jgi:putative intracellular protease/amidase